MSIELSNWPGAKFIADLTDSKRPAWLWDANGRELLWRNDAARLFMAKTKKNKLRLAKPAIPIKGQVRRLLRLGSSGVASLARVRFLVGSKPVSATCQCTPVQLNQGGVGLLIVAADQVNEKLFRHLEKLEPETELSARVSRSEPESETKGAEIERQPDGQRQVRPGLGDKPSDLHEQDAPETQTPQKQNEAGQLSKLLGRLSAESSLFEPVDERDEEFDVGELTHKLAEARRPAPETPEEIGEQTGDNAASQQAEEAIGGQIPIEAPQAPVEQWRITGRGFTPEKEIGGADEPLLQSGDEPAQVEPDTTSARPQRRDISENDTREIDRAARYNFDELSRILSEKVGRDKRMKPSPGRTAGRRETDKKQSGKTINLSQEVLVLNRLPVGILIFRDQDILFANRALADLVGAASISELKSRGLAAIFPQADGEQGALGPVLSIMGADGREVGIEARLQAITWQESPALMLSAQKKSEVQTATENSKSFVQALARSRNEGYLELDRSGRITMICDPGARLLGQEPNEIIGKPLSEFVSAQAGDKLRAFLERDAKTAQSLLPYIELETARGGHKFEIYTQGRAGVVQGYFGTIAPGSDAGQSKNTTGEKSRPDNVFLSRLSRGIRRPLNTILGFSELIGSEAFGKIENRRYVDYARDIETAGGEIAQLTDELDEYTQLEEEGFSPGQTSFDLAKLLDECMSLVRNQANRRQVFVRSAISENLPFIRADRGSIRQAILNLLASAIVQTPAGAKVILSAQVEDDGSVGIHVRDSSSGPTGVADRFVVFREQDKRGGEAMVAMKSSMGLALTRSLVTVNSCALHVDPSAGAGTLMSVVVPADLLEPVD